jgi:hypothetical protein
MSKIKTWRDRLNPVQRPLRVPEHAVYQALQAEIADLRKALDCFQSPQDDQKKVQTFSDSDLVNACYSFRHDFGLLSEEDRKTLMFQAKEWARAFGMTNTPPPANSKE